jgi:hypothetical protein
VPNLEHLDLASDDVPGANRRPETPIHVQEHRSRTGQILCDHGVQDGARHPSLYDDLAELRGAGDLLVVVKRVVVAADPGEPDDVVGTDLPAPPGPLPDPGGAVRPDLQTESLRVVLG